MPARLVVQAGMIIHALVNGIYAAVPLNIFIGQQNITFQVKKVFILLLMLQTLNRCLEWNRRNVFYDIKKSF